MSVLSKDGMMMKTIISLLTHSSSPGSAGFPSGCCRLKLWPSDHCQSESLAGKQTAEICWCTICDSHQLLWCYRQRLFPAVVYTVVFSFGHRCKRLPEHFFFLMQKGRKCANALITLEMISEMFFSDCLMGYLAMSH